MIRDSSGILLRGAPGRVAGPVVAFVVMEDPARLDRQLGRDEDRVAGRDMVGHGDPLVVGEGRSLLEDRVGDADLADVV